MANVGEIINNYIKQTFMGDIYRWFKYDRKLYTLDVAQAELAKAGYSDLPDAEKKELITDMYDAARKFRFRFDEYFYYDLKDKTDSERHEYYSDREYLDVVRRLNRPGNAIIFDDKYETYQKFREFYNRDVIYVSRGGRAPSDDFLEFIKKHDIFIVKPRYGTKGFGVRQVSRDEGTALELWNRFTGSYCNKISKGFLLEELIEQTEAMNEFSSYSVNTLRMVTLRTGEHIEIIDQCVRFGRSFVDKGMSRGIRGYIEKDTGVVYTVNLVDQIENAGRSEACQKYIGYKIPKWEEAVDFSKKLAMVVSGDRYTGWDIALTDKGWVMVEGNSRAQCSYQRALREGARSRMEAFIHS